MKPLLDLVNRFAQQRVLVIGEAVLDGYLQGAAGRLCREGPVPIIDIAQRHYVPGGAANTAANVASLGGQTWLLSAIGDDEAGQQLQTQLQQQGVDTHHLLVCPQRITLAKQRLMAGSHLLVRYDQGTSTALSADTEQGLLARLSILFPQCDAVVISDYGYGILTPAIIHQLAILQAQSPRTMVVDAKSLEAYAAVGVTAVKPNYGEAAALLHLPLLEGSQRVEQMTQHGASVLQHCGAQLAAITLDSDGALLFQPGAEPSRSSACPAPHSHAVGAGDTYVSALALTLAAGGDANSAAAIASAATAIVVQQPGTTRCRGEALRQSLRGRQRQVWDTADLLALVDHHRAAGQALVFTNGCFDILHSGHVTCLEQAKALGVVLIVGVNSDQSVQQLKGPTRPVNPLADRMQVLSALSCVDYVVPFSDSSPRELIRLIQPDVYAKGGDYSRDTLPETPLVEELGGQVEILPYIGDRSTTRLIQQIRRLR